ncbi:oxidoreductase [Rhodobacteraceae bacterium D3-12]|nr:oxidoreductase [Rhodobacteraceae bacterium D3-12]
MISKFITVCLLAISLPATLLADTAASTKSETILTVTGDISAPNADGKVEYTLGDLAELGATKFETTTIWTEGTQTFEGVELATLMTSLGVTSGVIKAIALNDYAVEFSVKDAVPGGAMLAYKRNGDLMSVRDKALFGLFSLMTQAHVTAPK